VGWGLRAEDLEPEDLTPDILHRVHRKIFCPENLTLGVTGDVTWAEVRPQLERMLDGWLSCDGLLEDPAPPTFPVESGVYVLAKNVKQSTIIIGKPSDVRLADDNRYFSSRIGNSILGGSGLMSRLASRIRTREGLAYSAASIWTTPVRSDGIIGAVTQTKSETTVAAIRLMAEILGEMASAPPEENEVRDVVAQITNGFVFNFQSPAVIVSRQMLYLSQNLPFDWLSRYLEGIQRVTPASVHEVLRDNLPSNGLAGMVILVVGDPEAFDDGLDRLGPIRILPADDGEP
jgi:zinc protease